MSETYIDCPRCGGGQERCGLCGGAAITSKQYARAVAEERSISKAQKPALDLKAVAVRLREAERLLQLAHDTMDDSNAYGHIDGCSWCSEKKGYDGYGLIHRADCIIRQLRIFLAAATPTKSPL